MKLKKVLLGSILSLSLIGLLTACAPEKKANNNTSKTDKTEKVEKITIGVMPAPDSAPLYVAQEQGFFKEEGIDADIQLFRDATKRDSAVSSGQLDATVTDLAMFTSYIKGKTGFKLGTALTGRFGGVSKDKNISDWKDLKNKKIGNFPSAATNYYRWTNFERLGLKDETKMVNIPELPTRIQAVASGQVDATFVPEPFLTMARGKGLNVWGISDSKNFHATAVAFNKKLSNDKDFQMRFNRAYNKAVDLLNKDKTVVKDVIVKDLAMPKEVAEKAKFPKFEHATSVDDKTFKDVLKFTKALNIFNEDINTKDYILDVKVK